MKRVRIIRSISIYKDKWLELQELAKKENRTASNMVEFLIDLYKTKKI